MSAIEITGLFLAALAAGVVNAVAGGGTLFTFPVLIYFGTAPVVANVTSTVALGLGTIGSVFGYRRNFHAVKPWLWRFVPVSILGALLGSALLTRTSNQFFAKLAPFLILFAAALFLAQGIFRRFAGLDTNGAPPVKHHTVWAAILFQFAVSVYGGYFGAGIGILMLASFGFIGLHHVHEMNAIKTVLAALINFTASAWFIGTGLSGNGLIDWPRAAIMTAGALAGYFLGSHYAQRISQARVRQIITAIGFTLAAITFYREFLR